MPWEANANKSFTINDMARGCSQWVNYGHILTFAQESGWTWTMLRDDQWARIEQLLPGKKSDPGRTAKDNRRFVEAVLWIMRTGSPWRDLPEELGHWHCTYVRFRAGARKVSGSYGNCTEGDADLEHLFIDSTIVRAHLVHHLPAPKKPANRKSAVRGAD